MIPTVNQLTRRELMTYRAAAWITQALPRGDSTRFPFPFPTDHHRPVQPLFPRRKTGKGMLSRPHLLFLSAASQRPIIQTAILRSLRSQSCRESGMRDGFIPSTAKPKFKWRKENTPCIVHISDSSTAPRHGQIGPQMFYRLTERLKKDTN